MLPILTDKLMDPNPLIRKGACIGLAQIMISGDKSYLGAYTHEFINLVKDVLCDETLLVRKAAELTFKTLLSIGKQRAISDIVSHLINEHMMI